MNKTFAKGLRLLSVAAGMVLLLGLMISMASADEPTEAAERSPAFRPPAPWIVEEELLKQGLITKDSSPEEIREAVKEWIRTHPHEPGGPNPRAYKRLLANEAAALAAGSSPKAMGLGAKGAAQLLVIPVEFAGTQNFMEYTDPPTCTLTTTVTITGPLHNMMPDPAGTGDNNTVWAPDFDEDFYEPLFFGIGPTAGVTTPIRTDLNGGVDLTGLTAANYFLEQSDGQYWLEGDVTPWVQVSVSEGEFGADGTVCQPGGTDGRNGPVWRVVTSATVALNDYWQTTYGTSFPWPDYDTDGDGIVDHLMIIHAGADQSAGGGAQGDYSIWAHSSNVNPPSGYVVDAVNNIKVLNYTIVPENVDIGVIVHEFGHDIGLPDLYDQTYATGNSTAFWELMSSGNWSGPLAGTQPVSINLWGRYMLGWVDPVVLNTTSPQASLTLGQLAGPPEDTEDGVIVNLPVRSSIVAIPHSGEKMWWSNNDKNMADSGLVQTFTLTTSTPISLTLWADYVIELDWDYFFLEVLSDTTWMQLPGYDATTGMTVTTSIDTEGRLHDMCGWRGGPAGCQLYHGLTGNSGGWANVRYDLTSYAGQTIQLRLTYATDEAFVERGMFMDDISIDTPAGNFFFDDVEAGPDGWVKDDQTFDGSAPGAGWIIEDGTFIYPHYYLAEWRNDSGFDGGLAYTYNTKTGTAAPADPNAWAVERAPYDVPGMLLWYRDYRYGANQPINWLFDDPSWGDKGMCMVVDAHPEPYRWNPSNPLDPPGFSKPSYRMQTKDAAFTLDPTQAFTLTNPYTTTPTVNTFASRPAVNQFHDSQGYYWGITWYDPPGGSFWDAWGTSVVIPAKGFYWPRYDAYGDLGNPGPLNYGVHIVVEDQAADGSWGKVHIWNDNDTFLGKKEVSDPTPAPGDTITYTIILKDAAGSDLLDQHHIYTATLADELPVSSSYVPGSFSFSGHGSAGIVTATGQITWTGTLGGEELAKPDAVIQYAVVTNDGQACNTAHVFIGAAGPTGYLPQHSSYELSTLGCGKFIGVEGLKTVDLATASRGDTLLYTIALTNTSETTATVTLNDHTPAWTTYVADSATGGATFVPDNPSGPAVGNVVWIGEIGSDDTHTITFEVLIEDTAPDNTTITNQAEVTTADTTFYLSASTLVGQKIYLPIILKNSP